MPNLLRHPVRLFFGRLVVLLLALSGAAALLAQDNRVDPAAAAADTEAPPIERLFRWSRWTENSQFDLNRCQFVASGDVNGDGRPDLICPYNYGGNQTRTFVQLTDGLGLSNWTRQREALQVQFDLGRCRHLHSGDLSGDGLTDLVCVYDYGGDQTRTFVQLNGGNNEEPFRSWTGLSSQFDPNRCTTVVVGDADGDGLDDVICPYNYGGDLTRTFIQFSDGAGLTGWQSQRPAFQTQFDLGRCAAVLSGDVNGDGGTDLICPYNYGGNQTRTFVQLSGGMGEEPFRSWTGLSSQFDLGRCRFLTAGDVNGDGFDDVICVYDYGLDTRTFVQLSSGVDLTNWGAYTAALQTQYDMDRCTFSTGDLNADGRMDLFCNYDYGSSNTATFVQMARENSYSLWLTATPATGPGQFAMSQCVKGVLPGDYNGDGHTDLACPYDYGNNFNRTFVQQAALYRLNLPSVIR
jgi:hypothetical protein